MNDHNPRGTTQLSVDLPPISSARLKMAHSNGLTSPLTPPPSRPLPPPPPEHLQTERTSLVEKPTPAQAGFTPFKASLPTTGPKSSNPKASSWICWNPALASPHPANKRRTSQARPFRQVPYKVHQGQKLSPSQAFKLRRQAKQQHRMLYSVRQLLKLTFAAVTLLALLLGTQLPLWHLLQPAQVQTRPTALVQPQAVATYLKAFQGRNLLFVTPDEVEKATLQAFPMLKQVWVQRHLAPARLTVTLVEHQPWAMLYPPQTLKQALENGHLPLPLAAVTESNQWVPLSPLQTQFETLKTNPPVVLEVPASWWRLDLPLQKASPSIENKAAENKALIARLKQNRQKSLEQLALLLEALKVPENLKLVAVLLEETPNEPGERIAKSGAQPLGNPQVKLFYNRVITQNKPPQPLTVWLGPLPTPSTQEPVTTPAFNELMTRALRLPAVLQALPQSSPTLNTQMDRIDLRWQRNVFLHKRSQANQQPGAHPPAQALPALTLTLPTTPPPTSKPVLKARLSPSNSLSAGHSTGQPPVQASAQQPPPEADTVMLPNSWWLPQQPTPQNRWWFTPKPQPAANLPIHLPQ